MATKLVIFDLDGTLLYTIEDLGNAVNHALELRSLPLHTTDEYRSMVGHGIRNLVQQALPEGSSEVLIDEALSDFKDHYCAHIADKTVPYPGITRLLESLSEAGVKLAVASNKFQQGTETLIKMMFPSINFTAVCGNSPDLPLKPDAALVTHILSLCPGISRTDAIMVGDSGTDIKTARNGGIRCIAVSWGYRPSSSLSDADYLVNDAGELKDLLSELQFCISCP